MQIVVAYQSEKIGDIFHNLFSEESIFARSLI